MFVSVRFCRASAVLIVFLKSLRRKKIAPPGPPPAPPSSPGDPNPPPPPSDAIAEMPGVDLVCCLVIMSHLHEAGPLTPHRGAALAAQRRPLACRRNEVRGRQSPPPIALTQPSRAPHAARRPNATFLAVLHATPRHGPSRAPWPPRLPATTAEARRRLSTRSTDASPRWHPHCPPHRRAATRRRRSRPKWRPHTLSATAR
mmetsp:Transcript_14330/g.49824  ORF Transcript_14330/g.49824 Transcript_14330/m.49824 type:complete len:201 (-) Transcript_14330:28-630(-)